MCLQPSAAPPNQHPDTKSLQHPTQVPWLAHTRLQAYLGLHAHDTCGDRGDFCMMCWSDLRSLQYRSSCAPRVPQTPKEIRSWRQDEPEPDPTCKGGTGRHMALRPIYPRLSRKLPSAQSYAGLEHCFSLLSSIVSAALMARAVRHIVTIRYQPRV